MGSRKPPSVPNSLPIECRGLSNQDSRNVRSGRFGRCRLGYAAHVQGLLKAKRSSLQEVLPIGKTQENCGGGTLCLAFGLRMGMI